MRLRLQHPMCCSVCASLTTNWCLNPRRRGNRCRYEKIGVSFLLSALRSFARAIFCSCRMRSLVTPNLLPTSSRVFGLPPSNPNRWKIIFRSRSSNTSKSSLSSSRMFLSLNNSNGVCASSSPTISPNAVESSSLIGASRDAGRIETVLNRETFPRIPISSASSSSVGSRPNPRSFAARLASVCRSCRSDVGSGWSYSGSPAPA